MRKQKKIEAWAEEKGIYTVPSLEAQLKGLAEEVVEICFNPSDPKEWGDVYVWWINGCKIAGVNPDDAVDAAYEKVSKRKGKTINGRFEKNL